MAANIPGGQSFSPGVYTETKTIPRGVAGATAPRIAAIIGEGLTEAPIVINAIGQGKDGLDVNYKNLTTKDGRHFLLQDGDIKAPFVPGVTQILRNSVPLKVIEQTITPATVFSFKYDCAFDPLTGQVLLQQSSILDQGGSYFSVQYIDPNANKGAVIVNPVLLDAHAPEETWYIRCIEVRRNSGGGILGTAKFTAIGSISGQKLDAAGNPYTWKVYTSGTIPTTTTNNGVIAFDIIEGSVVFEPGDQFVIYTKSMILGAGDSLIAKCIPQSFINTPIIYDNLNDIQKYHGTAGVENTLSLGCQLAFQNGASSVYTVQAAPPIPARTPVTLTDAMHNVLNPATTAPVSLEDFLFPLPQNFVPDPASDIHFFITDNTTSSTYQILPNKYPHSTTDTPIDFSNTTAMLGFVTSTTTYDYSYTLGQRVGTTDFAFDGTMTRKSMGTGYQGAFSSPSVFFDASYVGKWINIVDSKNVANKNLPIPGYAIGSFLIQSVVGGKVVIDLTNQFQAPMTAAPFSFAPFIATGANLPGTTTAALISSFQVLDGSGAVIASLSNSGSSPDGTFTAPVLDTATFTSPTIVANIAAYNLANPTNPPTQVKILNESSGNLGTYDITGIATGVLTLQKTLVTESGLRFEILDPAPSAMSWYVLVNRSIAADGQGLSVKVVSAQSATFFDPDWTKAFTSLEKVDCDVVVALPNATITNIFQANIQHCAKMSGIRYRKERLPIIGAIQGLLVDNVTGSPATSVAVEDIGRLEGIQGNISNVIHVAEDLSNYSISDSYGSLYRCVYVYPDMINKVMNDTATLTTIDGYFAGAAMAGYLCAQNQIQEPLTNKTLVGFTIPESRRLTPDDIERLMAAGACVLQPAGSSGGRVVWGKTTTQSGAPEEEEISIVLIRDLISKSIRSVFQPFIGTAEKKETRTDLNVVAVSAMDTYVSNGWITNYDELSVSKDKVEPRQWNVSVRVQPSYGINWIYINIAVGVIS